MQQDFFKWDKAFETGIAAIDIQHKVIIKILNELYTVLIDKEEEEKLDEIINELVQYTKYHFAEEEKLFKKYHYEEEENHKLKHNIFIKEIDDIIKKRKEKEDFLVIELINFLKDWLIEHILIEDQKYVTFFENNDFFVK